MPVFSNERIDFSIAAAFCVSKAAAISSNMINDGRLARHLARQMRCASPPEIFLPFSSITVNYPSGSLSNRPSKQEAVMI